jgi:hypothetical protein
MIFNGGTSTPGTSMTKRTNYIVTSSASIDHSPSQNVTSPSTNTIESIEKKDVNQQHCNISNIIKIFITICFGAGIGIFVGILIAIEISNTETGSDMLQGYSRRIHNYTGQLNIFNTPIVALPEANSRAIPPALNADDIDSNVSWLQKVQENANNQLRGSSDKNNKMSIVIPDYKSISNGKECIPLKGKPIEFMYHAQDGQDQLVNYVLKGKTNGFFVEFGAGDGSFHSNTKFFETQLCWTGLCIEPSRHIFNRLVKNRPKCIAVHGSLCEEAGIEREFTDVLSPTGWTGWSGFSETFTEQHKQQIQNKIRNSNWKTETYKVNCHTLESLMKDYGFKYTTNSEINYLSIDTEGSERIIIDNIDFQSINVNGVVQVEANLAEILQLGDEKAIENVQAIRDRLKNFDFHGPLTARSGLDEFFVSRNVWDLLDNDAKDLFIHHTATLPTKEQLRAEKIRQQRLRDIAGRENSQQQKNERRAFLNQYLQYDELAAAQQYHPSQGSVALNQQKMQQMYYYQQSLRQNEQYYKKQNEERIKRQREEWSPEQWEQQQLQQEQRRQHQQMGSQVQQQQQQQQQQQWVQHQQMQEQIQRQREWRRRGQVQRRQQQQQQNGYF